MHTANTPSYKKIATDFDVWADYIDDMLSKKQFDNMPISQRMAIIVETLGPESTKPFFVLGLRSRVRRGGFFWRREIGPFAFGVHRYGNCTNALVIRCW